MLSILYRLLKLWKESLLLRSIFDEIVDAAECEYLRELSLAQRQKCNSADGTLFQIVQMFTTAKFDHLFAQMFIIQIADVFNGDA